MPAARAACLIPITMPAGRGGGHGSALDAKCGSRKSASSSSSRLSLVDLPLELLVDILRAAPFATVLALCQASNKLRLLCPALDNRKSPVLFLGGYSHERQLLLLARANAIRLRSQSSLPTLLREVADRGRLRALSRNHPHAELITALTLAELSAAHVHHLGNGRVDWRPAGSPGTAHTSSTESTSHSYSHAQLRHLWEAAWAKLSRGSATPADRARWIAFSHQTNWQRQDEFLSELLKRTERSAEAVAAAQDGALVALARAYEGSIAVDPLPSAEGCSRRLAMMELFVRIYNAVIEAGGLQLALPLLVACVHAGVVHAIVAIFGWLETRRCGLDEQPHQPPAAQPVVHLSSSMLSLLRLEVRTMLVLLRLLESNFTVGVLRQEIARLRSEAAVSLSAASPNSSRPPTAAELGPRAVASSQPAAWRTAPIASASEWQASYRAAAVDAGLHQMLPKLLPDLVKPLDMKLVCEMLAYLVDVVEGANSAVRSDGPLVAL